MPWSMEMKEDEGVVVVTMNSNAANVITSDWLNDAQQCLHALETSTRFMGWPVVFTSASEGTFSAGLDLKVLASPSPMVLREYLVAVEDTVLRVAQLPVRTVAAVNGHTVAGGLFLALACDARVAAEGSYNFGANEVQVGVPLPAMAIMLPKMRLSSQHASDLLMTGRMYSPEEALQRGIVDYVVPKDELLVLAMAEATVVPPQSVLVYGDIKQELLAPWLAECEGRRGPLVERIVSLASEGGIRASIGAYMARLKANKRKAAL